MFCLLGSFLYAYHVEQDLACGGHSINNCELNENSMAILHKHSQTSLIFLNRC